MSKQYRIRHITTYTYSDRVTSSYGRGFLTPRDMDGQRCVVKSVDVDPAPTDQSFGVDVYGNEDVYFHVTSDHEKLVVTADSLVEVDHPDDVSSASGGTDEWRSARPQEPGTFIAGVPAPQRSSSYSISTPRRSRTPFVSTRRRASSTDVLCATSSSI